MVIQKGPQMGPAWSRGVCCFTLGKTIHHKSKNVGCATLPILKQQEAR